MATKTKRHWWNISTVPKTEANARPQEVTSKPASLQSLREQRESLQLQAEIKELSGGPNSLTEEEHYIRRVQQSLESDGGIDALEAYGDTMDAVYAGDRYHERGGATAQLQTTAQDYHDGDYCPVFKSEQDLARLNGIAHDTATRSTLGLNLIEMLKSYIIGSGFVCSVESIEEQDSKTAEAAELFLKQFNKANRWSGRKQLTAFADRRIYGERFTELTFNEDGTTTLTQIPSSWITEPVDSVAVETYEGIGPFHWKYGVATNLEDHTEVHGYFVCPHGDESNWRYVPAEQMIHAKSNTPDVVKRGLTDFYGPAGWANSAEKLSSNSLHGAAIQAAIALIRKHSKTSSAASMQPGGSSVSISGISGASRSQLRREEQYAQGTILDTNNIEYEPGVMGQSGGSKMAKISEQGDRRFGIRWGGLSYHMISGDASISTYASTLAAVSPFTKFAERLQAEEVDSEEELAYRVLGHAAEFGLVPGCTNREEVEAKITVKITPPKVAIDDRDGDHKIRSEEYRDGVISLQTYREETNRDHEEESQRVAEEVKQNQELRPEEGEPEADERDPKNTKKPSKKEERQNQIRESVLEALRNHSDCEQDE